VSRPSVLMGDVPAVLVASLATMGGDEFAAGCRAAIESLTAREQEVLRRRLGVGDAPAWPILHPLLILSVDLGRPPAETLREVADSLGISRERVRQIEDQALAKITRLVVSRQV
jgi:RNA polymerase sigma factor (sigma-70 family)